MNRKMTSAFWAMAAAVVIMVFNLNAYAQPARQQTAGSLLKVQCPDPTMVNTARGLCKDPAIKAACPTECAQVACIDGCLQPSTPGATTPTPAKKPLATLPSQLICEGGTPITDAKGLPDCGCTPEKMTLKDGTTKEEPRVSVLKSARYVSTDTTSQFIRTMVCASTGNLTAVINGRLNDHEKRIRALEDFAKEQGLYNQLVAQHINALWANLAQVRSLTLNLLENIQSINSKLATLDMGYGKLRDEIDDLKEGSVTFGLAAELSVFGMGDAGTAIAPGLRLNFRSFFPGSRLGYYATGNVGLVYRDGIDPSSGGQGSAYHAGFSGGLALSFTDKHEVTGYLGYGMEQFFRTTDPNFLGSMHGVKLGIDGQIPGSNVYVGGEGFVAGTHRVVYFSDDQQAHVNSQPALFGGTIFLGLRTDLF